ncbi:MULTISPECIES: gas vesicle protein GvpG [Alteribacter]|uniref:Gas vesicle protein GvpG n=1 Tax=Alteribacter keqinensis TaxID=2483800 RepID=A0A3M7TRU5_9BACI|nr:MULTISPECIES: gas vesicle protein GvpG [Alteribacter]MBM7095651.1 gas vesicle protein GvpG [Alteribacter salitolerans]RNA67760.1 gas vesicle protein GvpG [Alteribacter keqinensis]
MIFKLFTWPIDTLVMVGKKVKEEVDKELYDLEHIQQKLIHLQMMLEMEEISEEAYEKQEEELLERYRIAKTLEQERLRESVEENEGR